MCAYAPLVGMTRFERATTGFQRQDASATPHPVTKLWSLVNLTEPFAYIK